MWRAWGTFLLVLSSQSVPELGPRNVSPEHELAIRPPAGWRRQGGTGPSVVRYTQPGDAKNSAELVVTHLQSVNPTPLANFRKQAKEHLAATYKEAKILEEKDLTIGGRPALRIAFVNGDILHLKTVIHRGNLEYYLVDAAIPKDAEGAVRPVVEQSIASFEIIPTPLSAEELAGDRRTAAFLKTLKIPAESLGERWYGIFLGAKRIGMMRMKLSAANGGYAFEADVKNDFGDGNTDVTLVRGTFSGDLRQQKVDVEQTKVNAKERWQFRASVTMDAGKVKASRDMNGSKEDKSFDAGEGALLSDVAEFVRGFLVGAGRGTYLLRPLSPFAEEWTVESVEVGDPDRLEVDGVRRDVVLIQARTDRRKLLTYSYGPDRWLLRLGGAKEAFSIRLSTKEESEKK